jgi:hypothetical protein
MTDINIKIRCLNKDNGKDKTKYEDKRETKIKIDDLYSRIIRNHIFELLKVISSKYSTKFTKNHTLE